MLCYAARVIAKPWYHSINKASIKHDAACR